MIFAIIACKARSHLLTLNPNLFHFVSCFQCAFHKLVTQWSEFPPLRGLPDNINTFFAILFILFLGKGINKTRIGKEPLIQRVIRVWYSVICLLYLQDFTRSSYNSVLPKSKWHLHRHKEPQTEILNRWIRFLSGRWLARPRWSTVTDWGMSVSVPKVACWKSV